MEYFLDSINFKHSTSLDGDEESFGGCLTYFEGTGITYGPEEIEPKEYECGKIEGCYLNLHKLSGDDLLGLLDFEESIAHFSPLFDLNNKYEKNLFKIVQKYNHTLSEEENKVYEVLLLIKLEISPKFRGLGFGEKFINEAINSYGRGSSVVLIDAFPLQLNPDSKKENYREFSKMNIEEASNSLVRFYKSIGFETINGVEREEGNLGQFMVRRVYDSSQFSFKDF